MAMNAAQLIKMANQIGAFFASQPNPTQAREDFAQHLKRFWDPQMRTALCAHLDATGGEGLSEFVGEALRTHRVLL
ncbi:MAG: formate dehydrogenase subunit delta [Pseudomonas sp.]